MRHKHVDVFVRWWSCPSLPSKIERGCNLNHFMRLWTHTWTKRKAIRHNVGFNNSLKKISQIIFMICLRNDVAGQTAWRFPSCCAAGYLTFEYIRPIGSQHPGRRFHPRQRKITWSSHVGERLRIYDDWGWLWGGWVPSRIPWYTWQIVFRLAVDIIQISRGRNGMILSQ